MIEQQDLPNEINATNFDFPVGYQRVFQLGLTNLDPWRFIEEEEFQSLYESINNHYQQRLVIPFARRKDNDDVACFIVKDSKQPTGHVIIIHDFASPGWEVGVELDSFWNWFRLAIDEMIEWGQDGQGS